MRTPDSFFQHVHRALRAYRWTLTILVPLFVSALVTTTVLYYKASSDRQMLQAIAPYLSTLAESQDRPELLRIFHSIAETKEIDIFLIQDGLVLVSSRSLAEMDRPFVEAKRTPGQFATRVFIAPKERKTEILLFSSWSHALIPALWTACLVFLATLMVTILTSFKLKKVIRSALAPLDRLHAEIRNLGRGDSVASESLPIVELEEIRQTIQEAHIALEKTRSRLAEERAKKLSAESYKRLIHDLHTPVAALRQNIAVLNSRTDTETMLDAAASVPRIADQILRQVVAAKKNLDSQPVALRETDVRSCIDRSVQQVLSSLDRSSSKVISLALPETPVLAAHDPDLLQRAIINLLENGVQAAAKQVIVTLHSNGGHATKVVISDDGTGMDAADVALHLQGRGHSSKADRQAFGLSSANHIVRTHGGKIIYQRSPDLGGASFEIRLGVE